MASTSTSLKGNFTVDEEDSIYMQQAIQVILEEKEEEKQRVLKDENFIKNAEGLFKDVINNGIDREDMHFLKKAFEEMNKSENCFVCELEKMSTIVGMDNIEPELDEETRRSILDEKVHMCRAAGHLQWIDHPATAEEKEEQEFNSKNNKSGSARTEGFRKKKRKGKGNSRGIPMNVQVQEQTQKKGKAKKRKNVQVQEQTQNKGKAKKSKNVQVEEQTQNTGKAKKSNKRASPYSKKYKEHKLTISKDEWNNKRRSSTSSDETEGNFNQFKYLNKRLKLGKSQIHGLGLFAAERIAENEIITEYVGEIIRPIIADLREKKYTRSYCFALDDTIIVDATRFGNIARYINHSCRPNSYSKLLKYNKQKKIVIYSKKVINEGEEITYDYRMEPDDGEPVKCLCGARGCRKTLN